MNSAPMIRVLVVEDSAVAREHLVHLFGQEPELKVVGTAKDGLEAVEQAEQLRPDIILMDVHMPRMNGYEATRQIMERTPTPIVMMTANTNEDARIAFDALKAGALTLMDKAPWAGSFAPCRECPKVDGAGQADGGDKGRETMAEP